MARRKKRKSGTGSVIQVRKLNGLGDLGDPKSGVGAVLPVVIGGGVTALTTIGIRQFMTPTSETQLAIVKNAPWIGLGTGALVALAQWAMASQPAGAASFASSTVLTLSMVAGEAAARARMATAGGTAGVGAIVPQMASLPAGTGAIVMEPQASRGYGAGPLGSYGEVVNLQGARRKQGVSGGFTASAFGTPGFNV